MADEQEIPVSEEEISEVTENSLEETPDFEKLYLRALADLENSRRRFEEEKRQVIKFAQEGLLTEILPVLDNFHRATEHLPEDQKKSPWLTGILHIQKQLENVLENAGVTELKVKVHDTFDSTTQEAIATKTEKDVPEDSILEIKSRGYMLNGRLLRPAQVIVSTH